MHAFLAQVWLALKAHVMAPAALSEGAGADMVDRKQVVARQAAATLTQCIRRVPAL